MHEEMHILSHNNLEEMTWEKQKMNYKMIAVDMDGTLLDSRKQISDETVRAVRQLAESGVLVVISTGRPVQGVEKYKKLLHLTGPVITYNGAMIVDAGTGETLFEQGLRPKDARKIMESGLRHDTTMCIWAGGCLYGNQINAKMNDYKKISGVEPVLIKEFDRFSDQNITKILWYDEPGNLRKWTEDFGKEEFSQVTCCISQPVFLEFFHSQVSKAAAMQKIGERYGISREEMIAVGDGPNDIEMLEYAGLGIAMGNAAEEVKRHAGSVTASNDDEGVLQVIRKYF